MSTILEALQKSERERKLSDVPVLTDMPTPVEAPRWPLYLGVFIVLLLAALVFVLLVEKQNSNAISAAVEQTVINNETIAEQKKAEESTDLVVNVVSYSDDIDQRFAMVNGKMFRQGEFVRAGLKLVEITKDSVIFNNRGKRLVKKL